MRKFYEVRGILEVVEQGARSANTDELASVMLCQRLIYLSIPQSWAY